MLMRFMRMWWLSVLYEKIKIKINKGEDREGGIGAGNGQLLVN